MRIRVQFQPIELDVPEEILEFPKDEQEEQISEWLADKLYVGLDTSWAIVRQTKRNTSQDMR